jgi:hypothetical protein
MVWCSGLLVTLSTPWGGHELAASGVANSPVVIPSWYDMVPGSPYQEALFKHNLPEHLEYHLLFSHRGQFNMMSGWQYRRGRFLEKPAHLSGTKARPAYSRL